MKFKVVVKREEARYDVRFSIEFNAKEFVLVLEEDQLKAIFGIK